MNLATIPFQGSRKLDLALRGDSPAILTVLLVDRTGITIPQNAESNALTRAWAISQNELAAGRIIKRCANRAGHCHPLRSPHNTRSLNQVEYMYPILRCVLAVGIIILIWPYDVGAQRRMYQMTLKNGAVFEGRFGSIPEIARDLTVRNTSPGGVEVKNIYVVDDELRRTFFPKRNVISVNDAAQEVVVDIDQRSSSVSKGVGSLGAVFGATPFDEFGRRTITVSTRGGRRGDSSRDRRNLAHLRSIAKPVIQLGHENRDKVDSHGAT